MLYVSGRVEREPWLHTFTAEPKAVAELRRMLKLRLILWGLPDHVDVVQICVSELATNVIRHVGEGTPTKLRVEVADPYLRLEVEDPDPRVWPTLLDANGAAETGRGMALVDALTDNRWGVILRDDSKVVWCELAVEAAASSKSSGPHAARAEAIFELYGSWPSPLGRATAGRASLLGRAAAREAAIEVMADVLHWLRAHGHDPDDVLDRAQMHFEAEIGGVV